MAYPSPKGTTSPPGWSICLRRLIATRHDPHKHVKLTVKANALVCDCCGREIVPDEHLEWSEALRLRFTGGNGSTFDMS